MNSEKRHLGARGQAALEYLMTYGWAILVVVVVGVFLWQMGVLQSPPVAPGCNGFSNIKVLDTKVSGDALILYINNEAGTRLKVKDITAKSGGDSVSWDGFAELELRPGKSEEIPFTTFSQPFTQGEYYSLNIEITYENQGSLITHNITGRCWGNAE